MKEYMTLKKLQKDGKRFQAYKNHLCKGEYFMKFEEYREKVEEIKLDDYAVLLNLGRKWKKIDPDRQYNARIAILGSASIQLITSVTKALLTKYDIYANVYEGEYNGIVMDVFSPKSELYTFEPEYIIILPDYHDILDFRPNMLASNQDTQNAINKVINNYINIYNVIHDKLPSCQILISNFVEPYFGALGNLESNYIFSQSMFFKQVNIEIVKNRPSYVTIIDMERLAEYIGKEKWFDDSAYFLNKSAFNITYIGYYCDMIARQFEAFIGKAKKCLVLDLDNTLWGGVVGDQGYDGINVDPNDAEGEAFQHFQKYILSLKDRGIILAVCSKNDIKNAIEPFEKNNNMILRLADISCFVANWSDKASNIKLISKELNIGIDSLVFFDDNPTERALVKEFLPEVKVVEVPEDPALYVRALDQAFCFEWVQLTAEDISRVHSYADNRDRENLLESCVNYDDYLRKLEMMISFKPVDEKSSSRFAQLTNKSNQFNLRTVRYTEAEISKMINDDSYELFTVSMSDKFSNYGIIACVVLRFEDDNCFIENWVMSCRVLKKTVENYTIKKMVDVALDRGCKCINGEYLQSKKNSMVKHLYKELGFRTHKGATDEIIRYYLDENQMDNYQQTYYFKEDN